MNSFQKVYNVLETGISSGKKISSHVKKHIRNYSAAALLALSSNALADNHWTDSELLEGTPLATQSSGPVATKASMQEKYDELRLCETEGRKSEQDAISNTLNCYQETGNYSIESIKNLSTEGHSYDASEALRVFNKYIDSTNFDLVKQASRAQFSYDQFLENEGFQEYIFDFALKFQIAYDLRFKDGQVGPETLGKIQEISDNNFSTSDVPTIAEGVEVDKDSSEIYAGGEVVSLDHLGTDNVGVIPRATEEQMSKLHKFSSDFAFNKQVLILLHSELSELEDTPESYETFADLLVDAIGTIQKTYNLKHDFLLGPETLKDGFSKYNLNKHKENLGIIDVEQNTTETYNNQITENISNSEEIGTSSELETPEKETKQILNIEEQLYVSNFDINSAITNLSGNGITITPLIRSQLKKQANTIKKDFRRIKKTVDTMPKYFNNIEFSEKVLDVILTEYFATITPGFIDSYGNISTNRLQAAAFQRILLTKGLSVDQIKYLRDIKLQKKVIDNKYGTSGEIDTPRNVQQKTGFFSAFAKLFGKGNIVREAQPNERFSTGDSANIELHKLEAGLAFLEAGNRYEDLLDYFPDLDFGYGSVEDQGEAKRTLKKLRKEYQEEISKLTNINLGINNLGLDTDTSSENIHEVKNLQNVSAQTNPVSTQFGFTINSELDTNPSDRPSGFSTTNIVDEQVYADVYNLNIDVVADVNVPEFSSDTPLSGGSLASLEHFFQMVNVPGVEIQTLGDLREVCNELGIGTVFEDVIFQQQPAIITYSVNASGEIVITTVTTTETTHYTYVKEKVKSNVTFNLAHSATSKVSENLTETFGVRLNHQTLNNQTTGTVSYGQVTELKKGFFRGTGVGYSAEVNTESEARAILSLVFGKIVTVSTDTNGNFSYTLKAGFDIGDRKLNMGIGVGSLSSIKEFVESGRLSVSLNDTFSNTQATVKLNGNIQKLVSDNQLTTELQQSYIYMTKQSGKELSEEGWKSFYVNAIVMRAGNTLKSDISINPSLGIDTKKLDSMLISFANTLKSVVGISFVSNSYNTEYNGSRSKAAIVSKINNEKFVDGKSINFTEIHNFFVTEENIPKERVQILLKRGSTTDDISDFTEYSFNENTDEYIASSQVVIHPYPYKNAIISLEVREAKESDFDTSVFTAEEKILLEKLSTEFDPTKDYGIIEGAFCSESTNGGTSGECESSILSNLFAYYHNRTELLNGTLHKENGEPRTVGEILSIVRQVSLENMEERNASRMSPDRNIFKLATEKMHEGLPLAELLRSHGNISEDDFGSLVSKHMTVMRTAEHNVLDTYQPSSGFAVMQIVGINGEIETHVVNGHEKITGYGKVTIGKQTIMAASQCQNLSIFTEFDTEVEMLKYIIEVQPTVVQSSIGLNAAVVGVTPSFVQEVHQETNVSSENYSIMYEKEYTFEEIREGGELGMTDVFRPVNAVNAGHGSPLQIVSEPYQNGIELTAEELDGLQDAQRLYYGVNNAALLDEANDDVQTPETYNYQTLGEHAWVGADNEIDGVTNDIKGTIWAETDGQVGGNEINFINPKTSITVHGIPDLTPNEDHALITEIPEGSVENECHPQHCPPKNLKHKNHKNKSETKENLSPLNLVNGVQRRMKDILHAPVDLNDPSLQDWDMTRI